MNTTKVNEEDDDAVFDHLFGDETTKKIPPEKVDGTPNLAKQELLQPKKEIVKENGSEPAKKKEEKIELKPQEKPKEEEKPAAGEEEEEEELDDDKLLEELENEDDDEADIIYNPESVGHLSDIGGDKGKLSTTSISSTTGAVFGNKIVGTHIALGQKVSRGTGDMLSAVSVGNQPFQGANYTSMFPGHNLPKVDSSIYKTDIEFLEDKPWRKSGTKISDYFNYGFNETTWTLYCNKQNDFRAHNSSWKKIYSKDGRYENDDQRKDERRSSGRRERYRERERDDRDRDREREKEKERMREKEREREKERRRYSERDEEKKYSRHKSPNEQEDKRRRRSNSREESSSRRRRKRDRERDSSRRRRSERDPKRRR